MERRIRYHRFDKVTVRAAARLARMEQLGYLAPWELRFYLRELAALLPGVVSPWRLQRLALRRTAEARPVVVQVRLRRTENAQRELARTASTVPVVTSCAA